jgi:Outer membrane protein and related peptidoglycan-associated (lipo)proteins
MRYQGGTMLACAAIATLLSGCATSGALRRATAQQQAALAAEQSQRAQGDSALRQDMQEQFGQVKGDIEALRNELKAMRDDFGAKIAQVENGLQFAMPVTFAFNDATVRPEDDSALTRFSNIVTKYYPGSKVTIEGFADPAGSRAYNLALSQRRAVSVRDYLVTKGLTGSQLTPIGYGKTRLVSPGASKDDPGAELNRRVVFVIETRPVKSVAAITPNAK